MLKTITKQNWDNRVKTIQTKIRKEYGRFSNIGYYHHLLQPCIIEHQIDRGTLTFNEDRYKELRKELLSKEFNS